MLTQEITNGLELYRSESILHHPNAKQPSLPNALSETEWSSQVLARLRTPLGLNQESMSPAVQLATAIECADLATTYFRHTLYTIMSATGDKLRFIYEQKGNLSETGWGHYGDTDASRPLMPGTPQSLIQPSVGDYRQMQVLLHDGTVGEGFNGWVLPNIRLGDKEQRDLSLGLSNVLGDGKQDESLMSFMYTVMDFANAGLPGVGTDLSKSDSHMELVIHVAPGQSPLALTSTGTHEISGFLLTIPKEDTK